MSTRTGVSVAFFCRFSLLASSLILSTALVADICPIGATMTDVKRIGVESGCDELGRTACFTREVNIFKVRASVNLKKCTRVAWEFSDGTAVDAAPLNCEGLFCDWTAQRTFEAPGRYSASPRAYQGTRRVNNQSTVMAFDIIANPNPEPEPEPDPARRRSVRHR